MQTRSHLTGNGVKILTAIQAGKIHNKDIAGELKVTQAAVSQSLSRLRDGGFVRKLKNGELKVAAKGMRALGSGATPGPRAGSKMEAAMKVVSKMWPKKARKDIIGKLVDDVKLTKAGAATYFSILTHRIQANANKPQ